MSCVAESSPLAKTAVLYAMSLWFWARRKAACDWYIRPQRDFLLSFTSALIFDESGLSPAACMAVMT
jgi:hypothetical protein